jgi:hypothetical protein
LSTQGVKQAEIRAAAKLIFALLVNAIVAR